MAELAKKQTELRFFMKLLIEGEPLYKVEF